MIDVCKHCGAGIVPWDPHNGCTWVLAPPPGRAGDIAERWCPDDSPGVINRHSPLR